MKKPTVLIVDDDKDWRFLIAREIGKWDYPLVETSGGEEALDELSKLTGPTIVVTDFRMPGGMDGKQLSLEIKSLNRLAYVLMLTGLDDNRTVLGSLSAGADAVVTKPMDFGVFRRELKVRLEVAERTLAKQLPAVKDPLTDLLTRPAGMDRFLEDLARAKREQRPMVVMFIDLDNFKQINDTYHHSAGDKALRLVARRLQMSIRSYDHAIRWGGDEFALVINEKPMSLEKAVVTAMTRAERIRRAVHARKLLVRRKPKKVIRLSLSIGVTLFYPGLEITAEELVALADAAMYQAKKLGNRAVYIPAGNTE